MLLQLLKLIICVTALTNNCFNSLTTMSNQISHEIIILHFNVNYLVRQEKNDKCFFIPFNSHWLF